MEILRKDENQNLIINKEQDFLNDLGWQENMIQFEDEVLSTIINPIENYETVRYIHKPYDTEVSGLTFSQTDIWYNFYFLSGWTYTQDYNVVGIDTHENAKMLKQATQSFFRLEFYKTPHVSGTTYEPPTRVNRKLSFAKNLSLPLGEKYFYTGNNINEDIFFPVFMGSNYRNKENMYLFWFQDESVLSETVLSGDTFWMTVKFYNANDGTIIDFVNRPIIRGYEVVESTDMYYKLVIDRTDYSYQYYRYTGSTGTRVGESNDPIKFYQKGELQPTPTPSSTPTSTSTPTPTPTLSSTPTPTPTATTPGPTATLYYYYKLRPCEYQGFEGYTNGDYDVWSQLYVSGTFNSGDRVEGNTDYFYVVVGSQASTLGDPDPFGSHYSVFPTGLTGCPESVPPTTYRTAYLFAFGFTGSSHTYSEVMTDTCGKNPSNVIGSYTGLTSGGSSALYVDESVIVPGTIYQLWNSNISGGGSQVVGEGKYYAILIFGEGSTFKYIVYIDSSGMVSEWHTCP